ncbi:MAG TPA: right-handed parallel beta-helix repeat-containing protein [Solirubrobacteraceae bacterium]|nr:right-handed parallel beta-helix repeat-containing protein [Solirubrobacteraceae bacterium]
MTVAAAVMVVMAAPAGAHIERAAYWPDPAPDCSITPCAGGAVPKIRTLASALDASLPGTTRVVCQPDSMKLLRADIGHARRYGYFIRPTDHRSLSKRIARHLLRMNERFFAMCNYHEIQPAVTDSHNDDRVVVMPGVYSEPTARKAPTNDPACAQYKINNGNTGGAVSYAYQFHCPNDQNLIAVIGRALGNGTDPDPPLEDRHNIPNLGPCIRCNLQIEGSGPSADDVVVDAGRVESGDGPPRGSVKDVGIRADRADGFVLRNMTVRHAKEHDIYVLESDGYVLDRFKAFWAGEYGVLTFVEDHGLMQNCDAAGSGDSGLYPGAGADTGAERDTHYYPEFRYSQEIRYCDSHHNLAGYSGTDGNATHIDHNEFYDNALGFTTDVFTAPGHPGFPQDSDLIEYNDFYSNNFNPYDPSSGIEPAEPEPVGTGLWIAGGNSNVLRYNRFYDNWRRGTMLFAVPDATVCSPVIGTPVTGCDPTKLSTSYGNLFYGNVLGVAPDGKAMPNGTDFWWDAFPTNSGNCWWGNSTAPGTPVTSSPSPLPNCDNGNAPEKSVGTGAPANEAELAGCLIGIEAGQGYNPALCNWFVTPAKPGSSKAKARAARARTLRSEQLRAFRQWCATDRSNPTCVPFAPRTVVG